MSDRDEEMAPVTRAELREELKPIREEIKRFVTREELREDLKTLRDELKRLVTREELHEELKRFPTREELYEELKRHFGAMKEHFDASLKAAMEAAATNSALLFVDNKYSDLPPRVARLEAAVFPPKRKRKLAR